jgi:hypothetical protein
VRRGDQRLGLVARQLGQAPGRLAVSSTARPKPWPTVPSVALTVTDTGPVVIFCARATAPIALPKHAA